MSFRMETISAGGSFFGFKAVRTFRFRFRPSGRPEILTGLRKDTREKESIVLDMFHVQKRESIGC